MSKAPVVYKRKLPGKAKRGFGLLNATGQRLWLGPDHLLVINTLYFKERYKRFYFTDIQALTITRTTAGMILNVVFAILASLFGIWGAAAYFTLGWDPVAAIFLGIIAVCILLGLALNSLFGPTCRCFMYTPVHCEELFCLGRLWTARRVARDLRAIAEAAQSGTPDPTDMDKLANRQSSVQRQTPGLAAATTASRAAQELRHDDGKIHSSLFYLLLVDAVMSVSLLLWPDFLPAPVSMGFVALLIFVTVAAVIRQKRSDLPRNVRNVTWTIFAYLCLLVFFMYIFTVLSEFGRTLGEDEPPALEGLQTILVKVINSISLVFDLLLSFIGLRYLADFRRRSAAYEEPAAAPPEE
ncbi:MAG: hypothetical protein IT364_06165 [Candidatus Hydrogenedentes bacterium]|nr:hypothetical protein [Candidatus Hydrogenedentota bacterium]